MLNLASCSASDAVGWRDRSGRGNHRGSRMWGVREGNWRDMNYYYEVEHRILLRIGETGVMRGLGGEREVVEEIVISHE